MHTTIRNGKNRTSKSPASDARLPVRTQVKRGVRIVHGNKELSEKLGRNDLCRAVQDAGVKNCCLVPGVTTAVLESLFPRNNPREAQWPCASTFCGPKNMGYHRLKDNSHVHQLSAGQSKPIRAESWRRIR